VDQNPCTVTQGIGVQLIGVIGVHLIGVIGVISVHLIGVISMVRCWCSVSNKVTGR